MNEALLSQIPTPMLEVVIRRGLEKSNVIPFKEAKWSSALSDKFVYQELLSAYFPDESEHLTPVNDELTADQCEAILLHGIPFRYGHLDGIQKDYMLSVLSEDYRNQEKFLKSSPEECLTTNYVAVRPDDKDDSVVEFRHVSEIAAAKQDAKALALMLNAYQQLCDQDKSQDYSGKFFSENYNDIQSENAFLKEPKVKLNFINLEKIIGEINEIAMLESFDSLTDIGDVDKPVDVNQKKEEIKERREELAKTLIKGIKAITQKRFPENKQFSKREWAFVDFNEFHKHFMKNDLSNDNSPKGPKGPMR